MNPDYIADFYEGKQVADVFYVDSMTEKRTANGKELLFMRIHDKSGCINCISWEVELNRDEVIQPGVYYIVGKVGVYSGHLQLVAEAGIMPIRGKELAGYDLSKLTEEAPINYEEARAYIKMKMEQMDDPDLRVLCKAVLRDYWKEYATWPASRNNHHAFRRGNLMHVFNMLKASEPFAAVYDGEINRSLLTAGILLHDIGKIDTIITDATAKVVGYTDRGSLLGHPYLGAAKVRDVARYVRIPKEKLMMVEHVILGHHCIENGMPAAAHCPECEVLCALDRIDSTMEAYRTTMLEMEPGAVKRQKTGFHKLVYKTAI